MRAAAASPAIFNRTVADNLRVVAKVYPKFINITSAQRGSRTPNRSAEPLLRADLTPEGLAFITPRKARHHEARL